MYSIPIKFIPVILGFTLVLIFSNQAVQAQSLSNPTTPNSSLPSNASSTEQLRPLRNYIGIGGNIGVSGGGQGLSQGGVTIMMKNDLNDYLSIRGNNVFGSDRIDNTLALTVNFPVRTSSGKVQLVPYVGGGMLVRSKSNFEDIFVRGLVTSGIDIPLSRRLTATTAVNIGFIDKTDVGVQLGVAYNF